MLDLDAPDHTRLRGLVHKAFTPKLIEGIRARVETLTVELLDAVDGQMELIADYALPLPTTIIAEMLGVPLEDRRRFNRWSKALMNATAGGWTALLIMPQMIAFLRYIRKLVNTRRADPQDDLITALIQATESGDQMSEDELVAMIFLLLIAGHETTVNLIGNGTLALIEHPDQMAKLRENPALIKPAIEELVRFTSPVEMATERYALEDIALAETTIPRGRLVFAVIASANRDADYFENPDVLDIAREPNRHLSFGQGVHYCLGAPLARMEAQIAIQTLLNHFPSLNLGVPAEQIQWRQGLVLRGLEALPLAVVNQPEQQRTLA
jgi:cytochrome P450 PksS